MKSIRFITLPGLSLLTLGLAGAVEAQAPPTGALASRVLSSVAPTDETTNNGSDVLFEGMYGYLGVAGHRTSNFYFNVGGATTGSYGFAALKFDTKYLKNELAAVYPGGYTVTGLYVDLYEINAASTASGNVLVSFVKDETTVQPFGFPYAKYSLQIPVASDPYTATGNVEPFSEPGGSWTSTGGAAGQEQIEVYGFPTTGATANGTQDLIPLYGAATGVGAISNPSDPTGANNTDLLNHFLANTALTLVFNADPTTPTVLATWDPFTEFYGGVQYYTPQLIVVAKSASGNAPLPTAPTLAGVPDDQKVTLTWNGILGATSYNVYRSNASGTETSYQTGLVNNTYTDTGLTNGTTYYYQVTAVNPVGESVKSNEISAVPFLNPPLAPALTVSAATGLVQLTWTVPAHAVTYNVYRSNASGAETLYKTGLSSPRLTDFGLTNGTTYYYQVTAVDAAGESVKSNEASATKISVNPFTALSANLGNDAADSDLVDEGMYAPNYGGSHRASPNSLNAEGIGQSAGIYDGYFATRFNTTNIKNQIAENYGAGVTYTVQSISLKLTENNASFTTPGNVLFDLSTGSATLSTGSPFGPTTDFGYKYADVNENQIADPLTPSDTLPNEELLEVYPFATKGATKQYSIDTIPLYGSSAIQNPTNASAGADLLAAYNDPANLLTFVGRPQDNAVGSIAATPLVSATWNGAAFTSGSTFVGQPQLAVVALAAPTVTISGTATPEGVSFPFVGAIPLDPITVYYFAAGSSAHNLSLAVGTPGGPIATQAVTINPADGSFSFTPSQSGSYDLEFKTVKNLSVLLSNVDTTQSKTGLSLLLPAGDSNNDNSVDSSDFGTLIGAFNSDKSIPGSGYDPTVDFNYDGVIDSSDFGLLIGEFNNVGE